MRTKLFSGLALAALIAACSSTNPSPEPVGTATSALTSNEVGEPGHATAEATVTDCDNAPGPYVTLEGGITLSGLNLELIFTNNAKFTHVTSTDVAVSVSVLPANQTITIPKQPSEGGVGGNPWIYVQFVDASGNALTGDILLGRCVQGLNPIDTSLLDPLLTSFTLDSVQCSNSPGPYITFEGSILNRGVSVRFIFKNSPNGPHTYAVNGDLVVVPGNTTVTIPKQPVDGGVGGNPWIYLAWTDGSGNYLSGPTLLGRCNKL